MTLLELAAERALVADAVRRSVGYGTPEYWVEEIVGEMVVRLVERQRRHPEAFASKRLARFMAIDSARTATLDRPVTIGPSVDDHPVPVEPNQLDAESLRDRQLSEETAEQIEEWLSKPLTVRAKRAAESMKALGTSPGAFV